METAFRIRFSEFPRVLYYEDSDGRISFGFDGSPRGEKWLTLEHHSNNTPRGSGYMVAFNRVKQFLESRGYQVEIFGE